MPTDAWVLVPHGVSVGRLPRPGYWSRYNEATPGEPDGQETMHHRLLMIAAACLGASACALIGFDHTGGPVEDASAAEFQGFNVVRGDAQPDSRDARVGPGTSDGGRLEATSDSGQFVRTDASDLGDARIPLDGGGGGDAAADAGLDAGADAGLDAGTDAGVDAGTDAGVDAGSDGGVEAGVVDAGNAVYSMSDVGGDCNNRCSSLGYTCAGSGTVGLDCQAHRSAANCLTPGYWIHRTWQGADLCYNS